MTSRPFRLSLLTALAFGLAAPAMAQPGPPPPPPAGMPPMGTVDADGRAYGDAVPDPRPEWHGDRPGMPGHPHGPQMHGGYDEAGYQQARAGWLDECRRNHGNGNMVGGAVIGGVVGGRGNRVIGTVAGATVGAVAGGAIGGAADRRSALDYCESYLERYTTWQGGPGYARGGSSYGYAPMTMMVPVMMVQAPAGGQRECTTTVVTEEYVTETPRPKARRMIPARRAVPPPRVRDKRVRIN